MVFYPPDALPDFIEQANSWLTKRVHPLLETWTASGISVFRWRPAFPKNERGKNKVQRAQDAVTYGLADQLAETPAILESDFGRETIRGR